MNHTTIEQVRARIADAHREAESFRAARGRSHGPRRRPTGRAASSPR